MKGMLWARGKNGFLWNDKQRKFRSGVLDRQALIDEIIERFCRRYGLKLDAAQSDAIWEAYAALLYARLQPAFRGRLRPSSRHGAHQVLYPEQIRRQLAEERCRQIARHEMMDRAIRSPAGPWSLIDETPFCDCCGARLYCDVRHPFGEEKRYVPKAWQFLGGARDPVRIICNHPVCRFIGHVIKPSSGDIHQAAGVSMRKQRLFKTGGHMHLLLLPLLMRILCNEDHPNHCGLTRLFAQSNGAGGRWATGPSHRKDPGRPSRQGYQVS